MIGLKYLPDFPALHEFRLIADRVDGVAGARRHRWSHWEEGLIIGS